MCREILPTFPREFATPSRKWYPCTTEEEFYAEVNRYNKLRNIYFGLYKCSKERIFPGELMYAHTLIDKVVFDFDATDPATLIPEVLTFSNYLLYAYSKPIRHLICFSGNKGFHLYIFTRNGENLQWKKDTLYNCQVHFRDTLGIHPDKKLLGNLAGIFRLTNTLHINSELYCIPLTREDLNLGMNHIKRKAKKQNMHFTFYGNELLDLAPFDYPMKRYRGNDDMPAFECEVALNDEIAENFLPCVKCWLKNAIHPENGFPMGVWEARYQFALFCRVIGLPKKVCDDLGRKYFGSVHRTDHLHNNYEHWRQVHALDYAYSRDDFFMNCDTLYNKGLCPGKCKKYKEKGSPLYL